ncbi:MAG: hypothetical protein AAF270_04730 [Pseudomonadota bacterium]
MNKLRIAMISLAALFTSANGFAQDATEAPAQRGFIEVKTVVEKEQRSVNEAGDEVVQLVTAEKVLPGDVVIYTVTFTNISDEVADNVVITNPISENLEYVADSAFSPGVDVTFSVDNGQQFDALESLQVERDGQRVAAAPSDLTHIRWRMRGELAPGAQGFGRFRARVE